MQCRVLSGLLFTATLAGCALAGCVMVGPRSLKADQVDYARALGEGKKREIVALAAGLRYADLPGFVNVSQIIAAYTFDAGVGATASAHGDPAFSTSGSLAFSDHPTFTFTPTTGEYFAKAYIHPLAPASFMPLANTGVPIDLLMRISVQCIGRLQNATVLGGPESNGSPGFFELLRLLRQLQIAGELSIYDQGNGSNAVMLQLPATAAPAETQRIRELLKLPQEPRVFELVMGSTVHAANQIPIVTRSVLAILSDIGGEIDVPDADIQSGATKASIGLTGGEARHTIVIHVAPKAPGNPYVAVPYRNQQFWIDDSDFDSKYALTVVQDLMALAEVSDNSHPPVVTVPAR